ncbi:MAG: hypothetical protein ABI045_03715 [Flavobacteriales bacterium]
MTISKTPFKVNHPASFMLIISMNLHSLRLFL